MNNSEHLNEYQLKAIKIGLKEEELYDHDWHDKNTALRTLDVLKNRVDELSLIEAMNLIRGLNANQIKALEPGISRNQIDDHHDWNDPETLSSYIELYCFLPQWQSSF